MNCTLIKLAQVKELVGLKSSASIYCKLNPDYPAYDSTFPKPIKTGSKATFWVKEEIENWINKKLEARNTQNG